MLNYFRKKKQEKMNKIVDEVRQQLIEEMASVTIEAKRELESFVISKANEVSIDYYELSQNIEYDNLGDYIDNSEVADYVEVEASDIAYNVDVHDVAGYVDCDEIANALDTSEIAQYVEVDFDDLKSEIFAEVEDMVNSAIDDLEIKRA
jgi:hypothetical protein